MRKDSSGCSGTGAAWSGRQRCAGTIPGSAISSWFSAKNRSTSARDRSTKVNPRSVYVRWTARMFSGLRSSVRWLSTNAAADGQRVEQPAHQRIRLAVLDEVQDRDQAQRDRLVEVQRLGGLFEDAGRVPQIGVDVVRTPLGPTGQQGPRVREHDRVVVDVHDP